MHTQKKNNNNVNEEDKIKKQRVESRKQVNNNSVLKFIKKLKAHSKISADAAETEKKWPSTWHGVSSS